MKRLKEGCLAALLCGLFAAGAAAESVTVTTYYPAPYGGYNKILTTGETTLARDGDHVAVGKAGDAGDKLLVNGNTKLADLFILNTGDVYVKVPRPPSGKTLSWEQVNIGTFYLDSGAPFTPAPPNAAPPSSDDTCHGDVMNAYACPGDIDKTCVDIKRVQAADCNYSAWTNSADDSFTSDSCNGDKKHDYAACNKSCTDVSCRNWGPLGNVCLNKHQRGITYTPAKFQRVNVTCAKPVTLLVAR